MVSPFAAPAPDVVPGLADEARAPDALVSLARPDQERIGDGDERQRVHDTSAVPYRWICSLDVTWPGNEKDRLGRGSGMLIGPRQVLTAAHCIYRRRDQASPESVYVAPGRNGRTDPVGRIKAVAYTVPGAFLSRTVGGRPIPGLAVNSRFDLALVTLERSVADVVHDRAKDPRPYGHWGHLHEGRSTHLRGLDAAFLTGKPVTVAGYPGDWCGTVPFREESCDQVRDRSTVPFSGVGTVAFDRFLPGIMQHTADTHGGQSGSPVWMRFRSGARYLVGIHTGAGPKDDATQRVLHNRAVHLSPEVVAWVRSHMRGVSVA